MNKTAQIICSVMLLWLSVACEEVVTIDLEQTETKLVIDGLLTDRNQVHRVRLSQSIDFYGIDIPPVTEGVVEVVDGSGNRFSYTHNPEGYDSLNGTYFSDFPYQGQIGQYYTLIVQLGGSKYEATDTLRSVTSVDSLSIKIDETAVEDSENDGKIYQIILYAEEPRETIDFYYFRFFRDSVLEATDQVYAFDDEALGSLDGLPSPILFREGELAGVEIYSLTREQFVYYTDLSNILNNDGGMFSPPPANPRSTLSNGALGLWQVSAVSEASIKVEP